MQPLQQAFGILGQTGHLIWRAPGNGAHVKPQKLEHVLHLPQVAGQTFGLHPLFGNHKGRKPIVGNVILQQDGLWSQVRLDRLCAHLPQ